MSTPLWYMEQAYRLALKAKGKTSPNPLVGAVIVKKGRVIARGWHKRCGGDHAEAMALKQAGKKAKSSDLYVTLEPCSHYGRTPPCVDKIIEMGIKSVYIGMIDPNPLVRGKSVATLRRAGIKVKVGFLSNELEKMNEAFIKYMKYKIPFVVAKTAQTLDGKVATSAGRSKWITAPGTRAASKKKRTEFDAIMVGINTVLQDDPRLNAPGKRIKKVIVDSRLQVSPAARLFKNALPQDCFVATTSQADPKTAAAFRRRGVNVMVYSRKIDLRRLLKDLAKRQITSVLIEGGPTLIGQALKGKVVDKMHVYIAPKIAGDGAALNSVLGLKTENINRLVRLKDLSVQRLGEDIFVEGYVHGHR